MNFETYSPEWLRCAGTIAVEVIVIYAVAKLVTRGRALTAQWQRTIWQAAMIAVLIASIGELNGIRAIFFRVAPNSAASLPAPGGEVTITTFAPGEEFVSEFQHGSSSHVAATQKSFRFPHWLDEVVARLVWMGVTALLLLKLAASLGFTIVFRFNAARVNDSKLLATLERLAALLSVRRRVSLRQTLRVKAPFTFGVIRPVIVLPRHFDQTFTCEQQELAMLHELAHVRSADAAWRFASHFMCSLLWWHPVAWLIRHELYHASETAADEASALIENGPVKLAECLLQCAKQFDPQPRNAWIGMGQFRSGFGKRIERLTQLDAPSRPVGRPAMWCVKVIAPLALVGLLAMGMEMTSPTEAPRGWRSSLLGSAWAALENSSAPRGVAKAPAASVLLAAIDPADAPAIPQSDKNRHRIYELLKEARIAEWRPMTNVNLAVAIAELNKNATWPSENTQRISFRVEVTNVLITIQKPMRDITVENAINILTMVADKRIRYEVTGDGITFSAKPPELIPLFTRFYAVDLQRFQALSGGIGVTNQIIRDPQNAVISFVLDPTTNVFTAVKAHFASLGIDLNSPGKAMFFNDRLGKLMVRATLDDHAVLERELARIRPAAKLPGETNRVNWSQLIQDARRNYEMGKLEHARSKLRQVLDIEPENKAPNYYLDLVNSQAEGATNSALHTRFFRVDAKTFSQRVQSGTLENERGNTNPATLIPAIKSYLKERGVDLDGAGKAAFFNQSRSNLMIRATLKELNVIESALKALSAEGHVAVPVLSDIPFLGRFFRHTPEGAVAQIEVRVRAIDPGHESLGQLFPVLQHLLSEVHSNGSPRCRMGVVSPERMPELERKLRRNGTTTFLDTIVTVASGQQFHCSPSEDSKAAAGDDASFDGKQAHTPLGMDVVAYGIATNGSVQLTVLPEIAEFIDTDLAPSREQTWAVGGPYAIEQRVAAHPRYKLRQIAQTLSLSAGTTALIAIEQDPRTAPHSKSKMLIYLITAKLVGQRG